MFTVPASVRTSPVAAKAESATPFAEMSVEQRLRLKGKEVRKVLLEEALELVKLEEYEIATSAGHDISELRFYVDGVAHHLEKVVGVRFDRATLFPVCDETRLVCLWPIYVHWSGNKKAGWERWAVLEITAQSCVLSQVVAL